MEEYPFPTGAGKPPVRPGPAPVPEKRPITDLTGFIKTEFIKGAAKAEAFSPAGSVNYISQLPPVRSQGVRGTCVAFAVTGINEFFFQRKTGTYTDLSEQYLFFETKQLEATDTCNSLIADAVSIIAGKGQCPEEIWSYNPDFPCVQTTGKPGNGDQEAKAFQNNYLSFERSADLTDQLKKTLVLGHLIAFSLPVYKSWYSNQDTISTGRIPMPDAGEQPLKEDDGSDKGHALMIVGYQNDDAQPGGGIFIVRNSWGTAWGKTSPFGAGYGTIPYAFLLKESWEIYAIQG